MLKIFLRRIAILVPILFGITIAVFSLEALSPSDPAEVSIRENAMVPTPELIALTRHELGLDQPFLTRYGHWVSGVLHGDLGKSYITGRDVAGDIAAALPATLELAFAALLITAVVATVSGVLCARHPGSRTDAAIRSLIFLTSAFPAFWAGMLLMWLFAVKFDLPDERPERALVRGAARGDAVARLHLDLCPAHPDRDDRDEAPELGALRPLARTPRADNHGPRAP